MIDDKRKLFQSEFVDQETIDALIASITKYNNAKTAEEGFGALGNLINIGEKQLDKQLNTRGKYDR